MAAAFQNNPVQPRSRVSIPDRGIGPIYLDIHLAGANCGIILTISPPALDRPGCGVLVSGPKPRLFRSLTRADQYHISHIPYELSHIRIQHTIIPAKHLAQLYTDYSYNALREFGIIISGSVTAEIIHRSTRRNRSQPVSSNRRSCRALSDPFGNFIIASSKVDGNLVSFNTLVYVF